MENGHLKDITEELKHVFSGARNESRAIQSSAYLKDHFPFFGMTSGQRRDLQKPLLKSLTLLEDRSERWTLIRNLWEQPEREFQYFAIDWLNSWPKRWYDPKDGLELEWIISHKSWWDSVDAVASNYLGKWEMLFPDQARKTFEKWRYAESFWLQRSCLIYQLKHKDDVDSAFLESLIEQMKSNKEFFIQKAIGWSLRQLSKYNPERVGQIIERQNLSGLARREASKYL